MSGLPIYKKPAPVVSTVKDPRSYFSKETIAKFDAQKLQYPDPKAALIPILHHAQDEKGWVSMETCEVIATYLEMPAIRVWEVMTFYPMFHQKPVGKHVVWVCRNISCDLRGASEIVDVFHKKCGIEPGETSSDGKVTLKLAECLGGCTSAPMMDVDGTYHESLTPASVETILDQLK